MIPADMDKTIQLLSTEMGMPVNLVRAVVMTESSGKWDATRFEPGWKYWFKRNLGAKGEKRGQATSWGPMQVMGAVAREMGFTGDFKKLCGSEGIVYGCRKLKSLYNKHGTWDNAIRAYNTGRPHSTRAGEKYLAKVKKHLLTFKK